MKLAVRSGIIASMVALGAFVAYSQLTVAL